MSTREPRYRRIDEPLIPPLFIGLAIAIVSVFFLLAIFSYDYRDYSDDPGSTVRNLIGVIGAGGSKMVVMLFGCVSYILPFITLTYGLAWIFDELSFLRKRRKALGCLVISLVAFFGLHTGEFKPIASRLDIPNPAGLFGYLIGSRLFGLLGSIGGSLLAIVLYAYSLISISNFKFYAWALDKIDWIRRADQMDASRFARDRAREALAGPIGQLPNPEEDEESSPTKTTSRKNRNAKRSGTPKKGNVFAGRIDEDQDEDQETEDSAVEVEAVEVEPVVRDHSAPRSGSVEVEDEESELEPIEPDDEPVLITTEAEESENEPPVAILYESEDEAPIARPRASAADILGKASSDAAHVEFDGAEETPMEEDKLEEDSETSSDEEAVSEDDDGDAAAEKRIRFQPANRERPASPHRVAPVPRIDEDYKLPDMSHLQIPEWKGDAGEGREELIENARKMQRTLAQFKIEVALGEITRGPTITRYEMLPAPGVKLEKIVSLSNNIAAALQAQRISILAPIPGKSAVGIEAPNRVKTTVNMRDLMESPEWRDSKAKIPLVLGKDVYGKAIVADLADMPHLLIAGATGAGKSVCINAIIASLLYRFRPDEMRFVMIDPKVVELQQYNKLPHLVVPVVNDPKKVILALRWVVNEMEKRYKIFATVGVRNIHSFNRRRNKKPKESAQPELPMSAAPTDGFAVDLDDEISKEEEGEIEIPDRLSYVVVIIDELADLMLVAPSDVEMSIARITQMARAAGIHCIVATQRPSVDVITGVIKANIPCRIGFQVASKVDSRTILDTMGADKLLGKGDMLYLPPGSAQPIRAQGVFITDEEIDSIVEFIKRQSSPTYDEEIHSQIEKPQTDLGRGDASDEDEELIEKSIDIIRVEQKASVSLIQRRLRIGYTRAARIMDTLEDRGIVGPRNGAEPREILIDLDEDL